MKVDQNTSGGAKTNTSGTAYSEEVKRSYRETFFGGHSMKPYKYVGCSQSLWQRLKRIVLNVAGEDASVSMYVQNIVAYHLEEDDVKPLIAELSAASLLSENNPKAMDNISLDAKKYLAIYLTGDGIRRKEHQISISAELGKRLKRIVQEVDKERATMGAFVEAIIRNHLDTCADLINEMTNDSKRNTV